MNIYRDTKTNRLVKLARISPMKILGHWYEVEDLFTGKKEKMTAQMVKAMKRGRYQLVAVR